MDIKSLMVGDWVKGNSCGQHCDRNNKTYYKIAVLDIGTHCWGYSVCGGIVELKYDDIFPIPLTPEILEKNGFVYTSEDKLFEDIYPRISMLYAQYRLIENGSINYGEMSEIKYVHQLQHALRLCGISKEIEL